MYTLRTSPQCARSVGYYTHARARASNLYAVFSLGLHDTWRDRSRFVYARVFCPTHARAPNGDDICAGDHTRARTHIHVLVCSALRCLGRLVLRYQILIACAFYDACTRMCTAVYSCVCFSVRRSPPSSPDCTFCEHVFFCERVCVLCTRVAARKAHTRLLRLRINYRHI